MNWLKNLFSKKESLQDNDNSKREELMSQKEAATAKQEPWVAVVSMDVDPENVASGAFELDWNEFFIAKLIRAGYQGKTDADLVDQWFTTVCRNVVMETYEQDVADRHPVKSRRLDDGRREYN
jgi:hypothetical protein